MNQYIETPRDAANRLAAQQLRNGFSFEALHEYTDEQGKPTIWRIRLKNPLTNEKWIRPMKLEQNRYSFGEPSFPNGKPLYNLKSLTSKLNDPIIICEGEWCADHLKKAGILATTSGSADSADKADWSPLTNRDLLIWPDNDEAGRRYANTVANHLNVVNAHYEIIDASQLNLNEKGDAVNWLANKTGIKPIDIYSLPRVEISEKNESSTPHFEEESDERQSQASMLVNFVTERATLFYDQNKNVYAHDNKTQETRRLDGRQFKDWLLANFYRTMGKSPRDQSLREALSTLNGIAIHTGECQEVHIRVAKQDENYYIDLGEPGKNRAIQINSSYWKIVDKPPVLFIRPGTLLALSEPSMNGDFNSIWSLINIPDNARLLLITWLAECFRPDTPFPILELIGEQGSAKSTTQAILRQLIDPNSCNLRAAPKVTEDIFISANANWLISYENISHIPAPMQDALCIIATGGGFAKRKLYSDSDESIINVKRPSVINSISATITAQDLIDRSLSIELPRITHRTDITDVWKIFNAEAGQILGGLLNITSQALARLKHTTLPKKNQPRLAEFARLGMAIAHVTCEPEENFLLQFNATRQESIARTIDASPVASALIDWFEARNKRTTSMPIKTLFNELELYKIRGNDAWPKSPKGFADALRRAAPALRQIGIECHSLGKIGGNVHWEISHKE